MSVSAVQKSSDVDIFNARVTFNILLISASIFPFTIYALHSSFSHLPAWAYFAFLLPLIGTLSGTHVFSTFYVYVADRELAQGVWKPTWSLAIIPTCLIISSIAATTVFTNAQLIWFMVAYVHYGIFHFSRQNLGMLTLSTLSTMSRPINKREKLIINVVTISGVFAALKLTLPALNLDPKLFAIDTTFLSSTADKLFYVGGVLYTVILIYSAWNFFRNWREFSICGSFMYWISTLWYAPIFLFIDNLLLAYASFTTAHGLQYLVVVGAHAFAAPRNAKVNRLTGWLLNLRNEETKNDLKTSRSSKFSNPITLTALILPILVFVLTLYVAQKIWVSSPNLFSELEFMLIHLVVSDPVARTGFGLIIGITLAHYWVDQFIWRFRTSERRQWLSQRFSFLFQNRP